MTGSTFPEAATAQAVLPVADTPTVTGRSMDTDATASAVLPEVAEILQDLIRIDTSNYGNGRANPESPAADLVQALLEGVGIECQRFEAEPGRTNLVARWKGADPDRSTLLLHAHLDVVPVDPADWSVDPFGGEVKDGMMWGRGAVDMKNMVAIMVATVRSMIRNGQQPNGDVLMVFFADEESGCTLGSQWMVSEHPEVFAGVSHAIGEGGGYSVAIDGRRAYLMNTGEKGVLWLRMKAKGPAGHASLRNDGNAVVKLAEAVGRVGAIRWPLTMTDTTTVLMDKIRAMTGSPKDADLLKLTDVVGPSAPRLRAGLQNVSNVTIIAGGYKENVVPESASALVDVRFLPGQRERVLARIKEAAGPEIEVDIELELISMESPFEGDLVRSIEASIERLDPGALVLPHLIPGGTDAKGLTRLGITGYGFIPLRLPSDFNFPAMFHGVDERVPLDALIFGQDVLTDLLQTY